MLGNILPCAAEEILPMGFALPLSARRHGQFLNTSSTPPAFLPPSWYGLKSRMHQTSESYKKYKPCVLQMFCLTEKTRPRTIGLSVALNIETVDETRSWFSASPRVVVDISPRTHAPRAPSPLSPRLLLRRHRHLLMSSLRLLCNRKRGITRDLE